MDWQKAVASLALAFLALLCGALIFHSFALSSQLDSLSQKQAQTEQGLRQAEEGYASLNASCAAGLASLRSELMQANTGLFNANAKISSLQVSVADKDRQLAESRGNLEEQQKKAEAIMSELSSLENSINQSMGWFRSNAGLPKNYSWATDIFLQRVLQDCIDGSELNLACISYLMENTAFAVHYRTDAESSGKADFLQSVKQTINSGWGDCEDYSLLFKATLNSVRENSDGFSAVAWQPGGSSDFRVYPKLSKQLQSDDSFWYVPNSHKVAVGNLGETEQYVVCFRRSGQAGHCTVALSQRQISGSSGIGALAGAEVFEPQNGLYLGRVGSEFSICSDANCFNTINAIQLVIADGELYKFENGKWVGYSDYLKQAQEGKQELSG